VLRVRIAESDEAVTVHAIMRAAFAELQGSLPVESGAHTESVADVAQVMQAGGAVLCFDGDAAVGSARFTLEDEAVYVARVAVLPTHRRVMQAGGAVLCFDGDAAVGSARFTLEDEAVYVARVAVLPTHRRRGVASQMMRFLEQQARTEGKLRVRIGVRDSLPSNVGLYQALGYELVSINPHPRGPDRVWTMIKRV
jgi:ribosomal protein S18 acetylase RimI-like enzyme